jgi:UPF0716 protein FxsA
MPVLVVLFIVVPLVELFVILEVGSRIGVLPTIALILLTGVVGAALASSQGRAAWRRFNEALAEGRVPGRALLLTPGFITDMLGFLLLLPPSRAAGRRLLTGRIKKRARVASPYFGWSGGRSGTHGSAGAAPGGHRRPDGPTRPYDVEGTAREVRDDSPELAEPEPRV